MKYVTVTPQGSYNIFRVTNRMKEGCQFYDNEEKLGLNKGNHKVEFDIVVKNSKGGLHCTYFKRMIQENYLAGTYMDNSNTKN